MIGLLIATLSLAMAGVNVAVATERPLLSRADPSDVRVGPDRLDQIEVVGSSKELWQQPPRGLPSSGTPAAGGSQRTCPPQEYRWGKYSLTVTECGFVPPGEWAPWFENQEGTENEEGESVPPQVIAFDREDVQRLIVEPGSLIVQPDRSWVLVSAETVVMTDASEHILRTRVLDLDVEVRVAPVLYTWDFGDGSAPLTGTDPGAPWPNHTVSHVYEAPGTVTISLRTEWDAAFRVAGTSTWLPVAGRAVTTQSTDPIEVLTATPRLTAG